MHERLFPSSMTFSYWPRLFLLAYLGCGTPTDSPQGPPPGTVASVEVSPAELTLEVGSTGRARCAPRDRDAVLLSLGCSWVSRDTAVVKPTSGAQEVLLVARKKGDAWVVAAASSTVDSMLVIIVDPPRPPPPPPPDVPVAVNPGQSIQAAVNANPPGTVFRILAGTHRRQTVVPKAGNQFLGEPGAVMDGERVAVYAFDRGGVNVTIKGLLIRNYQTPLQTGSIRGDGTTGWVVDSNEVTESMGGGIRLGHKMQVRWNTVHHNHQLGLAGGGDSILVQGNEIAFNNWLKENEWGWEAGGTKFTYSRWLVVRANYAHDNWGPGLWTDIDNIYTTYEDNRVEDNAGPGIYHEISYDAVIRNNTIKRNGFDFAGWIWGGGIQISTSKNIEVYGNTLEDNKVGISVVAQVRGGDYATTNIRVHDNTVTQRSGVPVGAAADFPGDRAAYYAGITFERNTYQVRAGNQGSFEWADGCCRSWAQWKGYGQDVTGSLTVIP